ncbi:MAG: type II secretion system protein [Candidatus Omnitrophota bacterium]|jgi:prepilin-type N-terminal cleavage/methylation domain-containing protein
MALFPHKISCPSVPNKKGFTLIEIIVATLVIVALAGGLFSTFWGSQYFLNRARHRIQAYNFAVEALDKLRGSHVYYSSPAMDIGSNHAEDEIETGGMIKGELDNAGGELTYDIAEPQANGYKEVSVRVRWNETAF